MSANSTPTVKRHPEQAANEVWVGNTQSVSAMPEHVASLKTIRLGNQAYDIDGKKISPDYYRPLFVGVSEIDRYDQIMMERTFGKGYRR